MPAVDFRTEPGEGRQHFVVVSARPDVEQWLSSSLKDEADLIVADSSALDRVLQLIDAVSARLVFVELTVDGLGRDAALMEGLVAAKPLLPVVAVADRPDPSSTLTALRAGARDFASMDMRASELVSLSRRVMHRDYGAPAANETNLGEVIAVASARPGADAPMFALHLALALQAGSADARTLLLDLGVPAADTLLYLGIQPSYTFVDAVRSLRRLDATLIDTAFAKHKSGLRLLAMPEEFTELGNFTSVDLYVLLGSLRRHFSRIVINLGGVPASDFLYALLGRVDRTLFLVEQSVPSCKQNLTLLQHLRDNKVDLARASVVVDRYLAKIPPDAAGIADGFGLPLLATLPSSGMARLTMMNSGESLFEGAPRDPYTLTLKKLAQQLGGRAEQSPARGWLQGLSNLLDFG